MKNIIPIIFIFFGINCYCEEKLIYNELNEFILFKSGVWESLIPGNSTVLDVKKFMGIGEPSKFVPSLLSYSGNEKFKILIYFDGEVIDENNKIKTIDFLPKMQISMKEMNWPNSFIKNPVRAVDATWIEYSDGSGVIYKVYSSKTRYGNHYPGDLYRISYGAPNK